MHNDNVSHALLQLLLDQSQFRETWGSGGACLGEWGSNWVISWLRTEARGRRRGLLYTSYAADALPHGFPGGWAAVDKKKHLSGTGKSSTESAKHNLRMHTVS